MPDQSPANPGTRREITGMARIYQILHEQDRKIAPLIERASQIHVYRPFGPICPRCEPLKGRRRQPPPPGGADRGGEG